MVVLSLDDQKKIAKKKNFEFESFCVWTNIFVLLFTIVHWTTNYWSYGTNKIKSLVA